MNLTKLFAAIYLFCISHSVVSQTQVPPPGEDPHPTFQEIQIEKFAPFESQLDTMTEAELAETNTKFRKYLQWKRRWETKIHPDGNFTDYYQAQKDFMDNNQYDQLADVQDWYNLGPNTFPSDEHLSSIGGGNLGVGPLNWLTFDPNFETTNLMFTGGWNTSLWFSTDGGDYWEQGGTDRLMPDMSVADCKSSHLNSDVWFIITGDGDGGLGNGQARSTGMYRTIDQGESWDLIGSEENFEGQHPQGWHYDPHQLKNILLDPEASSDQELSLFVTGTKGVFKANNPMGTIGVNSTDNIEWTKVLSTNDLPGQISIDGDEYGISNIIRAYSITFSYDSQGNLNNDNLFVTCRPMYVHEIEDGNNLIVHRTYILKSTDLGETWENLTIANLPTGYDQLNRLTLEVSKANPDLLYVHGHQSPVGTSATSKGRIFIYNMSSDNWVQNIEFNSGSDFYYGHETAFEISQNDENLAYLTRGIKARKYNLFSENSNAFSAVGNYHVDLEDIEEQPGSDKVWFVTHGGLSVYNPADDTWEQKSQGIGNAEATGFSSSQTHPERMLIGLYHDGSMISGGAFEEGWTPEWKTIHGGDGQETLIDYLDGDISYRSSQGGKHQKNSNGFSTNGTSPVGPSLESNYFRHFWTDIDADYSDSKVIYMNNGRNLFRHEDRGIGTNNWVKISDAANMEFTNHLPDENEPDTYPVHSFFYTHNSQHNENLIFSLALDEVLDDGDPENGGNARRLFVCRKPLATASEAQTSWFELPYPDESLLDSWIKDVECDPDDPHSFYVAFGNAYLNSSWGTSDYKVTKYTYTGSDLYNDPVSVILDGGQGAYTNWEFDQITEGFPNIAIQQFKIMPGTREYFIATTMGVFYSNDDHLSDSGDDIWFEYGGNIPYREIEEMELLPQFNRIRVATYGRGVWENKLPCTKRETALTISENETWENDRRILQDIIVQGDATLTISGTVYHGTDVKIIVEPGGHLIVDGGTLTNACGEFWQGIEVWGDATAQQTNSNQGKVTLKNGATIENAIVGVAAYKLDGDGFVDSDFGGGIIQARNANFLNNKQAVGMATYQNYANNGNMIGNRSYFDLCDFELNDDYLGGTEEASYNMVRLWKVDGVRFSACDFVNTRDVATSAERKSAISTLDANFRVNGKCTSLQQPGQGCPEDNIIHSNFNGFDKAIHAMGGSENAGPEIKEAIFSENMVGIQLDATLAASATFNQFTVGNNSFPPVTQLSPRSHVGIVVTDCDEYTIEENEFTGDDVNGFNKHGVYSFSDEYNANSNTVYKNSFDNMTAANIASGYHADPNTSNSFIGLRYVCNDNQQNTNDFELRPNESTTGPSEISNYQNAGPGIPAGNTFSQGVGNDNIYTHVDFFSDANYQYLKSSSDTDPIYDETKVTPGNMFFVSTTNEKNCPTHFTKPGKGIDKVDVLSGLSTNADGFNNLYYSYVELIDEGNTQGMINEIDLSWPQDAWDLHAQLMARSPYNSEAVLIAAADKGILTDGMLLEILLANPDALRSGRVIKHVQVTMADPLPEYMIEILQVAAQSPQTIRSTMEKNLSNLHYGMVTNHRLLLHDMMNDTIEGVHPDTLMAQYRILKTLKGRYQQIYGYLGNQDHIAALAVIDTIQLHYKLTLEQGQELVNTEDFVNFIKDVETSGRNVGQLTPTEISNLQDIANEEPGGMAAERAENILCFFYNQCEQSAGAPKNNQPRRARTDASLEELISEAQKLTVSPNPADHYVLFEYELLESSQAYTLRITDVQGRVVEAWNLAMEHLGQKTLDTRSLPNGVYLFELVQNEKKIKTGKFIVQH